MGAIYSFIRADSFDIQILSPYISTSGVIHIFIYHKWHLWYVQINYMLYVFTLVLLSSKNTCSLDVISILSLNFSVLQSSWSIILHWHQFVSVCFPPTYFNNLILGKASCVKWCQKWYWWLGQWHYAYS